MPEQNEAMEEQILLCTDKSSAHFLIIISTTAVEWCRRDRGDKTTATTTTTTQSLLICLIQLSDLSLFTPGDNFFIGEADLIPTAISGPFRRSPSQKCLEHTRLWHFNWLSESKNTANHLARFSTSFGKWWNNSFGSFLHVFPQTMQVSLVIVANSVPCVTK